MARRILFVLTLTLGLASGARAGIVTATFEDLGLAPNTYVNNAGPSGRFISGGTSLNNSYDSTYGSWSGWSISRTTDVTTPGYTNYSAIAGSGGDGSATYAVADTFAFPTDDVFHPADSYVDLANGTSPLSVEVTNATYAYLAMKNGYAQARAFVAGDTFRLDIRGYTGLDGTGQLVGEIDFYLADFRGTSHAIVNTWQTLDLTPLAGAKSLRFGLRSTDNDATYGMNTPAYVAIDNLRFNAVPEPSAAVLALLAGMQLIPLCRRRSAQGLVDRWGFRRHFG